jgi:hypothetical protein
MPEQVGGNGPGVRPEPINKRRIPKMVEVSGPKSGRRDALVIAATIIVVRGVEGLVQVTDKMKQALERHDPLFRTCRRTGQFRREGLHLIDNAIPRGTPGGRDVGWHRWMAKAGLIEIRRADFDVDEVPLPRVLPRVARVAQLVGLGRRGGDIVPGE